MKKLILIAMILGCSLIADNLDKLERSYLSKAEALQSDSDTKIKVIKDKLATDSKRLAESYLKALKAILKAETQKGDFDAAIKVKAKIVEIENILRGQVTRPEAARPELQDISVTVVNNQARLLKMFQGNWYHGKYKLIVNNSRASFIDHRGIKIFSFTIKYFKGFLTMKDPNNGWTVTIRNFTENQFTYDNTVQKPYTWTRIKIDSTLARFKGIWEITNNFETIIYEVKDNEVWHKYIKNGTTSYSKPQKVTYIIIDGILGMPHISWSDGKHMGTKYNWIDLKNNRAIHTNQKDPSGTSGGFRKLTKINNVEKTLGYKLKRHPIGARLFNGHYYKYHDGFISWQEAYAKCKEMGGYLTTITTKEEYAFLIKHANLLSIKASKDVERIWIGGTMQNSSIKWITGEADNKDLKRIQFHNNYTHVNLHSTDYGLAPARPSGRNGKGVELIRGFICEWEK